MKVQEIMERAGISATGRSIAYIKTERLDIVNNKRFYNFPKNMIKILDIRCKNHDANDGTYKSIPRTIYEPATEDTDGF